MELDTKMIGSRIKNRRKELHLTQTSIKETAGISSGNISDIENGNRLPSASTLVQLAGALHCSVDWILTGNSPNPEILSFSEKGNSSESELIDGYRSLPACEQEELLAILRIKLHKIENFL